ncbi:MAG: hypothetical protein U0U67_17460 [Chitinophagales bacterium]
MENNDKEKYLQQIADIKNIMESNSRFLTLSGLSGIWAGATALCAAAVVIILFPNINEAITYGDTLFRRDEQSNFVFLFTLACLTLVVALIGGYAFTAYKAKKYNQKIWNATTKKITVELFFILAAGGLFCLCQMYYGIYFLTAPTTLLFYGIGLFTISKYTVRDIRYLAVCITALGLINAFFLNTGIFFWAIGFGVLHIFYGTIMYFKYDRN